MPQALDVVGELTLQVAGTTLLLRGQGGTVTVEAPDMGGAVRALNALPHNPSALNQLASVLASTDLKLQLVVGREQLVELGAGVNPGWAARLLGLPGIRVHPWQAVLGMLGLGSHPPES